MAKCRLAEEFGESPMGWADIGQVVVAKLEAKVVWLVLEAEVQVGEALVSS